MSKIRQIYLLDPQQLPPETIAVTFAKTSRSPETFKDIAAELSVEKSAEFHEKWVVGYGHSSVAEHAVLHIAIENLSRLAVECLESNRLASYTEKSTRYQKWEADNFYIPSEFPSQKVGRAYLDINRLLFQTYQESLPVVQKEIARQFPRKENESEGAWERRIRPMYVDVCRFFLPASALANVGMTINARALEHAIRKMLSHPLKEVQSIGEEIKKVSKENVPTLVKYANEVPYWVETARSFELELQKIKFPIRHDDWCQIIFHDADAEKRILAGLLYRYSNADYQSTLEYIQNCSPEETQRLIQMSLQGIQKFDIPPRELEYAGFTFDLIMDQGAFFEIKRHRMMTQTAQSLTTDLGYAVPKCICEAGFEKTFHSTMEKADKAYRYLAEFAPELASYVVPNAFNRRILLHANLRSLDHMIALRSAPNAHFSVRRVVHRMAEEIGKVSPLAKQWIREDQGESWQEVEENYFCGTMQMPAH
jgi:thymidylate synthase ThyX